MKKPAIASIKLYKLLISPFLPASCRFLPSCSDYAIEAIERHGGKGFLLAIKRIMKCHPFGASGIDPVPLKEQRK